MAEHTPGPWVINGLSEYRGSYEINGCNALYDDPEGEANIRLIAAAPDMLEALRQMVICKDNHNSECSRCIAKADTAIAKAKGETR